MDHQGIDVDVREHSKTDDGPVVIATLRGRITVSEAERFAQKTELVSTPQPSIAILDCSGLAFVSSAGIGELIKLQRLLSQTGAKMFLASVQPDVMKLLEQSRLDEMMPMYESVDQALLHVER